MKNLILLILVGAGIAYAGSKFYLHKEVEEGMDALVLRLSSWADIEYEGVSSTMGGQLTIDGIRIDFKRFRDDLLIDQVGIDTPSYFSLLSLKDMQGVIRGGIPDHMTLMLNGVHMQTDSDYYRALYELNLKGRGVESVEDAGALCTGKYGFSPETLQAMGYKDAVSSNAITVRNNKNRFGVEIDIDNSDMWKLHGEMTFGGNPVSGLSRGLAGLPKLVSMDLQWTDHSLKDRIQKHCAEVGLNPEQTLNAQLDAFFYEGTVYGVEFDEYVMGPFREFLEGKKNLQIKAAPNEPLSLSQVDLYKPSDVPALLNLEAVAY